MGHLVKRREVLVVALHMQRRGHSNGNIDTYISLSIYLSISIYIYIYIYLSISRSIYLRRLVERREVFVVALHVQRRGHGDVIIDR